MAIYNNDRDPNEIMWERQNSENKIITVDITYRLKIEIAPGDDPKEILHEMDADFAWPETQAAVVSQEIMDLEYYSNDDERPYTNQ